MSLGLAVSAFTPHRLDLTFDTATLLSPPFAMSLAVGLVVTAFAFFAPSSYITVCRPNTPTESSSAETQSRALISPAPKETSNPEAQDTNTPDEHRLHR